MVTWTVTERQIAEPPTFSLSGVLVSWADGSPALVEQTAFRWDDNAWCVSFVVTGSSRRAVSGVLRIDPEVAELWRSRRLNPRREVAAQLRAALAKRTSDGDLGVLARRPS